MYKKKNNENSCLIDALITLYNDKLKYLFDEKDQKEIYFTENINIYKFILKIKTENLKHLLILPFNSLNNEILNSITEKYNDSEIILIGYKNILGHTYLYNRNKNKFEDVKGKKLIFKEYNKFIMIILKLNDNIHG